MLVVFLCGPGLSSAQAATHDLMNNLCWFITVSFPIATGDCLQCHNCVLSLTAPGCLDLGSAMVILPSIETSMLSSQIEVNTTTHCTIGKWRDNSALVYSIITSICTFNVATLVLICSNYRRRYQNSLTLALIIFCDTVNLCTFCLTSLYGMMHDGRMLESRSLYHCRLFSMLGYWSLFSASWLRLSSSVLWQHTGLGETIYRWETHCYLPFIIILIAGILNCHLLFFNGYLEQIRFVNENSDSNDKPAGSGRLAGTNDTMIPTDGLNSSITSSAFTAVVPLKIYRCFENKHFKYYIFPFWQMVSNVLSFIVPLFLFICLLTTKNNLQFTSDKARRRYKRSMYMQKRINSLYFAMTAPSVVYYTIKQWSSVYASARIEPMIVMIRSVSQASSFVLLLSKVPNEALTVSP